MYAALNIAMERGKIRSAAESIAYITAGDDGQGPTMGSLLGRAILEERVDEMVDLRAAAGGALVGDRRSA